MQSALATNERKIMCESKKIKKIFFFFFLRHEDKYGIFYFIGRSFFLVLQVTITIILFGMDLKLVINFFFFWLTSSE